MAFMMNVFANMEALQFGDIVRRYLIIWVSRPLLTDAFFAYMVVFRPVFKLWIKFALLIANKKCLMMVQCVIYYGPIQKILKDGGLVPEVLGKEIGCFCKEFVKSPKKKWNWIIFVVFLYLEVFCLLLD